MQPTGRGAGVGTGGTKMRGTSVGLGGCWDTSGGGVAEVGPATGLTGSPGGVDAPSTIGLKVSTSNVSKAEHFS